MNVGELQINITNHGLIGSQYTEVSTYADAPSAQWPAGSGNEYLWSAGLWVGGRQLGQTLVSTGQYEREFRPGTNIEDTIYEAKEGRIIKPSAASGGGGTRLTDPGGDDDGDGEFDEEILDGYDNDGDFLVDEDFGQVGDQMMVCTMYDNTPLGMQEYPDHTPLNLKVVQTSFAWTHADAEDFVGFEFDITNIGPADIEDVYVGLFTDCDIGRRSEASPGLNDLAGFWEGFVRASDGSFVPVSVGYMFDGAVDDPLPGYFGVTILDIPLDFTGWDGPDRVWARTYQNFAGQTPFHQGGDPTNDNERYYLMSQTGHDPDITPFYANDLRFLITVGPWRTLASRESLNIKAALVVGDGLEDLLRNTAEAGIACFGNYHNLDGDYWTGTGGRESLVCLRDFPTMPNGTNALFTHSADFWDKSCIPPIPVMEIFLIGMSDLFLHDTLGRCIYVNKDNCWECERRAGRVCRWEDGDYMRYSCGQSSWRHIPGCTGTRGGEVHVPWVYHGISAPPPPGFRLWPRDNSVHIFWDDSSRFAPDLHTGEIDFEAFRIWRVAHWERPQGSSIELGPESRLWEMIAQFDEINQYIRERHTHHGTVRDTLDFGANTGFEEISYRPACLADPRFEGLAAAMQEVVDNDVHGAYESRPGLWDSYGNIRPELAGLAPWVGYPAVLDTFFLVASRQEDLEQGIAGKRGTCFFEYVDRNLLNGFLYFYAVTAMDHSLSGDRIVGTGLDGDPGNSFDHTRPGAHAQTPAEREKYGPDIYVFPNPVTRPELAQFQPFFPNEEDPTGVRIMFANLPQAHNLIRIYTLDGDLVAEIDHDGTSGIGYVPWNLVTLHGQQIVSGIYLYVVQSDDSRFDDFIGKFVVIK